MVEEKIDKDMEDIRNNLEEGIYYLKQIEVTLVETEFLPELSDEDILQQTP